MNTLTNKERVELVVWLMTEYGFTKANAQDHIDFHYPKNYNPKDFSKEWTI